jgi:hypothetical protein
MLPIFPAQPFDADRNGDRAGKLRVLLQPGLLRRWKRTELIRITRKGVGLPRGLMAVGGLFRMRYDVAFRLAKLGRFEIVQPASID